MVSYEQDWSLSKYRELCNIIKQSSYEICTMANYFSKDDNHQRLMLRHDIDRFPNNALQMAKLENELGLPSTYYVRFKKNVFSPQLIEQLQKLNREVGYHYEVLDTANGNIDKAIELFKEEIKTLRLYASISTAAAHGSPLSKWDNRTIWETLQLSDIGLIGEAYLNVNFNKVAYYTDTGRCWDANLTNIRDRGMNSISGNGIDAIDFPQVHCTDDLMNLIKSSLVRVFCLQTHPERWSTGKITHLRSVAWDYSTNFAKLALGSLRG